MKFFDWLFRRKKVKEPEPVDVTIGYKMTVEVGNLYTKHERRMREREEAMEKEIFSPLDVPVEHKCKINYGETTAIVESGFYKTWMDSIRDRLPTDVVLGVDIVASVSLVGNGRCKVVWKARNERGGAYLLAMANTLSNPQLSEVPKLENKE